MKITYTINNPEKYLEKHSNLSSIKKLLKYTRLISCILIIFLILIIVFSLILPNHQEGANHILQCCFICFFLVIVLQGFFEVFFKYQVRKHWEYKLSQKVSLNDKLITMTQKKTTQTKNILYNYTINFNDIEELVWDKEKNLMHLHFSDIKTYKNVFYRKNGENKIETFEIKEDFISIFLEDSFAYDLLENLRQATGKKIIIIK